MVTKIEKINVLELASTHFVSNATATVLWYNLYRISKWDKMPKWHIFGSNRAVSEIEFLTFYAIPAHKALL